MVEIKDISDKLQNLKKFIQGEVYTDKTHKILYATDASAYKEMPAGVCIPKSKSDIVNIIKFAKSNRLSIIPRAAGTSLAGQVVGNGLVVDVSKYFNNIIEINENEKWVKCEPSVVLDELNRTVLKKNLFFGPETSTSNRCMIGGMIGNNSCGAHSLIYGSTRDHIIELECILSDGSIVCFRELSKSEFYQKCKLNSLEGDIYRHVKSILENKNITDEIKAQYPDKEINRRNTGYALDILLDTEIFSDSNKKFNLAKLIAGSEGTLAFIISAKLNLVNAPPKHKALVCIHTKTLEEAFKANLIALKYKPDSVELMDKIVLDLTKDNINQKRNRFFVDGDPAAILIVEWSKDNIEEVNSLAAKMIRDMQSENFGYSYPIIYGSDIPKVWNLRKAGLGILSNMKGDAKPVPVIEDTAVIPSKLPEYMQDLSKILKKLNLKCVFYAHIGTGELHTRPILNLKNKKDVELFHTIAYETALLVKKYGGSLSGEHGDGRLRGQFIPLMYGDFIYQVLKDVKKVWDPSHIFNSEKIVDTPPMNSFLRYNPGETTKKIDTIFNFDSTGGFIRATEKCNGSGDCRKPYTLGGTICPSFQATKDEKHSTRARANILREIISNSSLKDAFTSKEIYDVLDLCLLCKACKSECPSGVDVAKLKMEFLQHYYDFNGVPARSKLIARLPEIQRLLFLMPSASRFIMKNKIFTSLLKKTTGFHHKREIPVISKRSLNSIVSKNNFNNKPKESSKGKIYFLIEEFSNYLDAEIGISAINLFSKLGYEVKVAQINASGRTWLSKGLIRKAKKIANKNIMQLKDLIFENQPIIGIEPSAVLTFRDEYPELASKNNLELSKQLAANTFLFDEFICAEMDKGNITKEMFSDNKINVLFHGHCQQKALVSTQPTHKMFTLLRNCRFEEIPSGCCGMAGSFGYEKDHYDVSMKIGEMVLFPAIRKASSETIISATGTSCRCQISDGTSKLALHPIEILEKNII